MSGMIVEVEYLRMEGGTHNQYLTVFSAMTDDESITIDGDYVVLSGSRVGRYEVMIPRERVVSLTRIPERI